MGFLLSSLAIAFTLFTMIGAASLAENPDRRTEREIKNLRGYSIGAFICVILAIAVLAMEGL